MTAAASPNPGGLVSRVPGYRWMLLVGLMFGSTSIIWYAFAIGLLIPEMRDDIALSPTREGWLSASFFLASFLFTIPLTNLLSRLRPVPLMSGVFVATTLLFLLAAYVPTYPAQFAARFVIALLFIAINPVRTLLTHHWFRPHEYATANGVVNSVYGVISPVAFWTTAPLLELFQWQGGMLMLGGLSAITTLLWIVFARDRSAAPETPHATAEAVPVSPLRVLFRRDVQLISLVSVGGEVAWATFITFWPTLAQDELHFDTDEIAFVLGLTALLVTPASLLAPWLVARTGRVRLLLMIGPLIQVPIFVLLAATGNGVALILVALAQGFAWFYAPILNTVPFLLRDVSAREIAVILALMQVVRAGAQTLGPAAAGMLAEIWPLQTVLILAGLTPLLSTVAAALIHEPPRSFTGRPGVAGGRPAPSPS